ncbi:dirigent protein 1-like [Miscanthus floridulus]|uniref:dirigent protein 1-like n=1 Tax=Miscanthus floridulus TaxID=154761 RepID=UPI003458202D
MMYPRFTRAAALLAAIVVVLQLLQLAAAVRPAPAVAGASDMQHLHFFMHDGYPTAVLVVNGSTAAPVLPGNRRFGDTMVMALSPFWPRIKGLFSTSVDDVLTEGPSRASRPVGRAQGTYVLASLEEAHPALLLSMNLVLADGSTVAVMGRNDLMAPVRELSVVGGTGRFRMATGYVLWKTASWRADNAAVLELDVFLRAS